MTGRRELTLTVPANAAAGPATGRVFLAAVSDDRQFLNKPDDPSTPSIDGDVSNLPPEAKDRMVGRQRNGFGHAMGDVSLAANESVTKQVRSLIEQGLKGKGFQLTKDPAAPNVMTVSTQEFWSWMTPGLVALTFEAKIRCTITVTNATGSHTLVVKGYGLNHGQFAKDVNFVEAFDPAYADFLDNFANNAAALALRRDATVNALR
ncbi:MAG: YajG family lipoprotein [Steroidobacteraceae bacterium]